MLDYQLSDHELVLSGQLKTPNLEVLKEALRKAAGQGGVPRMDISQVDEVDARGLQLLLAWLRRPDPGVMTRLQRVPETMDRALRLGGLQPHFAPFIE